MRRNKKRKVEAKPKPTMDQMFVELRLDTKQFQASLREAKRELKDFERECNSFFNRLRRAAASIMRGATKLHRVVK